MHCTLSGIITKPAPLIPLCGTLQEGSFESLATPRSKGSSSERESSLALLSTAQQVRHMDLPVPSKTQCDSPGEL